MTATRTPTRMIAALAAPATLVLGGVACSDNDGDDDDIDNPVDGVDDQIDDGADIDTRPEGCAVSTSVAEVSLELVGAVGVSLRRQVVGEG